VVKIENPEITKYQEIGINLNIIHILMGLLEEFVERHYNVKNASLNSIEFERDHILLDFTCEKQDLEVEISYGGWVKNVKRYPEQK